MTTDVMLTEADRRSLQEFRSALSAQPTRQLLDALVPLESAARRGITPRCRFAVLANHLCLRLDVDLHFVMAHPDGIAAGIMAEHRARQVLLARTN